MKVYRDIYQPRPYFIDPVVILNKRTVTESWLNKFTFYNNGGVMLIFQHFNLDITCYENK